MDAALTAVTEALGAEEDVKLVGFGMFEVKVLKERTDRNPKTRKPVQIPTAKIPAFCPDKQLKDAVGS